MKEKNIFVYKLFLLLDVSDFSLLDFSFLDPAKAPLCENLVGVSTPTPSRKGGAHYVQLSNYAKNVILCFACGEKNHAKDCLISKKSNTVNNQECIQRGFATGQLVWDPKLLPQIYKI